MGFSVTPCPPFQSMNVQYLSHFMFSGCKCHCPLKGKGTQRSSWEIGKEEEGLIAGRQAGRWGMSAEANSRDREDVSGRGPGPSEGPRGVE